MQIYFKPKEIYEYKYLGRQLGWGLKSFTNVNCKNLLEPKWRQVSFSLRYVIYIYIYIYGAHIYIYKISAFISKDDDTD